MIATLGLFKHLTVLRGEDEPLQKSQTVKDSGEDKSGGAPGR